MITIENNAFVATIDPQGAQLTSVINKADHYDYIWSGDATYWGKHAPILFPSIGKSNDDTYEINGKAYPMTQHGFARDYPFDIAEQEKDTVTLVQTENDATLKLFPFHYRFAVTFALTNTGLHITFTVSNTDQQQFAFALGFHPAFNVKQTADGQFDDYNLSVQPINDAIQQFGIDPAPFRDGTITPVKTAGKNVLPLTHDLLDDGLVILANTEIEEATLSSLHDEHSVTLNVKDFPYLTLWSPEHKQAPFICVEPFAGLPDVKGQPSDLFTKEGNQSLPAGDTADFGLDLTLR